MTTDAVTSTLRTTRAPGPVELSDAGLAVALLGLFMAVADFFIVNVALPSISRTTGADAAALELVVAGYGTAYAVFLVLGGRLGDTHGRRRLFLAGIGAFTLASAACGLAPTAPALIVARVVQGSAAAAFVPQVLAIIQATLTGNARLRALSWYGATLGSAAVVGQLVGGVLVQLDLAHLAWRPVFLVNVPIGLATIAMASRLLPETRSPRRLAPDLRGAWLLGVALLALLVPATMGREMGWPAWMLAILPVAPVALVALVAHGRRLERHGGEPLLPSSLLALPGIRAGIGVSIALFLAAGGFFLTTALSLQDGLAFGPLASGMTMAPYAVAFLVASLLGRGLVETIGSRSIALGGMLFALGMAGLAAEAWLGYPRESLVTLAPPMIVVGAGQGLVVAPLMGVALHGVPGERAGTASGLLTTIVQAALAVGAASIGLVFFTVSAGGPHLAGYGHAEAAVAAVQAALGAIVALLALQLPEVRTAGAEAAGA